MHPPFDDLLSLVPLPPSIGFNLSRLGSTAGRWFWGEEGRQNRRAERLEVLDSAVERIKVQPKSPPFLRQESTYRVYPSMLNRPRILLDTINSRTVGEKGKQATTRQFDLIVVVKFMKERRTGIEELGAIEEHTSAKRIVRDASRRTRTHGVRKRSDEESQQGKSDLGMSTDPISNNMSLEW